MKNVRLLAVAATLAAIALTSMASAASADSTSPGRTSTAIYLFKGQTLTVAVNRADSGSTGYHWRVASKGTSAVLKLKSSRPSPSGKSQVLTFTARAVGYTHLRLAYVPPGRHRKAARKFDDQVVVNKPEPKVHCYDFNESKTVASNSAVRVFTVRRTMLAYLGGKTASREGYDAFYGCEFAADRAFQLSGAYARDQVFNISLNGSKVGFALVPACPITAGGNCSGQDATTVQSVDLHTGELVRYVQVSGCGADPTGQGDPPRPECYNQVTGLFVSPTGGLAWIEAYDGKPSYVHRSDRPAEPGQRYARDNDIVGLDEPGTLDPNSLRYDGSEIRYLRDGREYRAPLR